MTLEEIVKKCIKSNRKAQKALYELCHKQVMGICLRYCRSKEEAEDVFQECFIKIFEQLEKLRDPQAFWGWMKALTIRTCLSHFRKNTFIAEDITEAWAIENNAYEAIFSQMQTQSIIDLINKLPEGYKLIFNLFEIEGYRHSEIAEMLNISIGTSKSQLSKAKALLCKELQITNRQHPNTLLNEK
ncbi:DNA-directed RNA polymerase sigma-70 factor [Marivirga lumbricoides]|uniref:DNA-directed RNA polymerase sigma-70 factor n=1 Tax=Marivirga lumbricoides TaxID=1046115 RepID=A0ABQ1N6S4_9BACT|nr:DNA-directed RNA polymerase sigma-70 factor [Marivirga lumbricoides]